MPLPLLAPVLFAGLLIAIGARASTIYTCTDAQGRRITSDRPIVECMDREQRELSGSGMVRRIVRPPLTAAEQAAADEKARREAESQQRAREDRLRQRALLARYPNPALLESERASALGALEKRIAVSQTRLAELGVERRRLEGELAGFKQAPGKAPAGLSQSIAQVDAQRAEQDRFIADQVVEKVRLGVRFDEMRRQLEPYWPPENVGGR